MFHEAVFKYKNRNMSNLLIYFAADANTVLTLLAAELIYIVYWK